MAVNVTSCGGLGSNPLSEIGSTRGDNSVPSLEKLTGLDRQYLMVLYVNGAGKNLNVYAGYLYILIHGWSAIDKSFSYHTNWIPFVVSTQTYKDFINKNAGVLYNCGLLDTCLKVCPAGKSGQLNDLGRLGLFSRLTGFQITNPMTGPATCFAPGIKDKMDQMHSGFLDGLQDVCQTINTHAYLKCFTMGTYGGLQEAVHSVTNLVQDFYSAMMDMYKGLQLLCLQAQVVIEQYIADLEFFLTNYYLSDKIQIFLNVVCLLLATIQTTIDDIAFFASLFNGSDNLYKILNVVQNVVNIGAQAIVYVYHPVSAGLPALFPKEAKLILDFINNLGDIPSNYFGILLKHFSFGKAMNNKGIAIANAIIQHYGIGAQLGDLNPMLQSFGCAVPAGNWHRTAAPVIKGPVKFKVPNIRNIDALRASVSLRSHSVSESLSNFWQIAKKDFSSLTDEGGAVSVLEKDANKLFTLITDPNSRNKIGPIPQP